MSRTVHPMTSCVADVLLWTQGSAVSHFGAIWTRDMFRINKLLINYRTARAGSGALHAGRVYIRAVQLIEFDSHAHLVSKAGSVIGAKSPSPVFKRSGS